MPWGTNSVHALHKIARTAGRSLTGYSLYLTEDDAPLAPNRQLVNTGFADGQRILVRRPGEAPPHRAATPPTSPSVSLSLSLSPEIRPAAPPPSPDRMVSLRVLVDDSELPRSQTVPRTASLHEVPALLGLPAAAYRFFTAQGAPLDPAVIVEELGDRTDLRIRTVVETASAQWKVQEVLCTTEKELAKLQLMSTIQKECQFPSVQYLSEAIALNVANGLKFRLFFQHDDLNPLSLRGDLSPQQGYVTLVGIAHALRHIHSLGIVHNNLSPDNVLFSPEGHPLLAGFHHAFRIREGPTSFPKRTLYSAPEITERGVITPAIDVYSFGVLIQTFRAADAYRPILEKCMEIDARERPTAAALVQALTGQRYQQMQADPTVSQYLSWFEPDSPSTPLPAIDVRLYDPVRKLSPLATVAQEKGTGAQCVIKSVPVRDEGEVAELEALESVPFPSVARYTGIEVYRGQGKLIVWLQLAYQPNGSLQDAMRMPDRLDLTAKHIIVYGIAKALEYLEEYYQGHGNLRPSNVLLNQENEPVLIGYTVSPRMRARQSIEERVKNESLLYCAPEVLKDSSLSDAAGDVYSFGMILYSLMYGAAYADEPREKLWSQICSGAKPPLPVNSRVSPLYRKLIVECAEFDPQSRPTAADLVGDLEDRPFMGLIDEERFNQYRDQFD
jgi:serine/threonine protein kinase